MPVCATCGAELPANSTSDHCADCTRARAEASGTEPAKQEGGSAVWEHIAAFPVTTLLIVLNLLVFMAIVVSGVRQQPFTWPNFLQVVQHPSADLLIRWGANYGPLTTSGPWWQWLRLLTNTFVHIGIVHLVVNMWALLNLGALAEYLFGRRTTLLTYVLTGIAGSVTSLAWHPAAVSAGASGAIFGIAGALLVAFRFARLPLSKNVIRSTSVSLLIFAGYTLAYGIITGRMDNAAHLGGLGAGLIFGIAIILSKRQPETDNKRDEELQLGTLGSVILTVCVLLAAVIVGREQRYIAPLENGRKALRENNVITAVADLRRAVNLRPKLAETHDALAEAYYRTRRFGPAYAELTEATRVQPKSAEAWNLLGTFFVSSGRAEEATYACRRAVELSPKTATYQFDYGVALHGAGRFDDAASALRRAMQLDPKLTTAEFIIGVGQLKQRKLDDAIATLKHYLDRNRSDANGWAALAEAYRQKGMTTEAQDAQRRAEAAQRKPEAPSGRPDR